MKSGVSERQSEKYSATFPSAAVRVRGILIRRGRRVVIEICMAARADGVLVFHFLAHPIEQLLFVFRRHRIHYKPNYRQTQSSQPSTRSPENGGGAKFHIWLTRSPEKMIKGAQRDDFIKPLRRTRVCVFICFALHAHRRWWKKLIRSSVLLTRNG